MHIRCYDASYHSYHRYGGRGIKVHPDWHSYKQFVSDMWEGWFEGATIDRYDNDGDYSAKNCTWLHKLENKKPLKYDMQMLVKLRTSGMSQQAIADLFGTNQGHISRLLKRLRNE